MQYRKDRYGNDISLLGYGCMRFTRKGGSIDFDKAEKELLRAIELGVNYFDTAYIYTGSEELLGKFLTKHKLREQISIATKLPQYMLRNLPAVEKTFAEELRRLQTDYIDYYLMHMFTDYSEWEKLQEMGIENWISQHKADGSIRQIGFSYHGEPEMFLKILDAYDWDFCQIQYNYLDEYSQAGRRGLEAAAAKGIPVIIMEPLRGGKLVNLLPHAAKERIQKHTRGYSPAEWGLRWLWEQEAVTCVLSGMNSLEMVEENCRIASCVQAGEFTEDDHVFIAEIIKDIRQSEKIGCTGCRYCMPCPKGVDIPSNFHYYNLMGIEKKSEVRFEFARGMAVRENPGFASACVGCGACEKHCPQHLPIIKTLAEADRALRPLPYRIGMNVARRFMLKR